MPKKDDIDPKDRALFRESVRGTVPLGKRKPAIATVPEKPETAEKPIEFTPLSDHISEKVTSDTELSFRRDGISHELLRKMKRGNIQVDGTLDLHRTTVEEARELLLVFLADAKQANYHYLRIIHGRGTHGGEPILKNLVNSWLQQLPQVLAFCSAPRHDGGTGAVYVLLRR